MSATGTANADTTPEVPDKAIAVAFFTRPLTIQAERVA
jgi:hypothetical protein